jgi:ABC-2 type transport system permease protein
MVSPPSEASLLLWLPALGMLALLYVWALRSAVGFEDESVDRAARRARMITAARTGNWHLASEHRSEAHAPFPLPSRGPRLLALTWKNLISAESFVASPILLALGLSLLFALIAVRVMLPGAEFLKMFGAIMVGVAPMVCFVGPELARFDLRQDLPQADILKALPLPGWQIVLGELLAPALALTLLQWLMILAAAIALPEMPGPKRFPAEAKWSIAATAALLAPALNLTLLLLHNASALLFPAWVRLGPAGAAGFEAMGQRLLLMLAHLLGLLVALLVPAVLATGVFFVGRLVMAWTLVLPLAGLVGALALGFQWALGLKLLGDRFERLDITE